MELDLLLLPVPGMASKQPQLGSSLAPKGPPVSLAATRAWVLQSCCSARGWGRSRALAVEALSGRRQCTCCQAGWGKPGNSFQVIKMRCIYRAAWLFSSIFIFPSQTEHCTRFLPFSHISCVPQGNAVVPGWETAQGERRRGLLLPFSGQHLL